MKTSKEREELLRGWYRGARRKWDESRIGTFKTDIGHSFLAGKLFLCTPVFSKWENPSPFHCSAPFLFLSYNTPLIPYNIHHSSQHPLSAADTPDPPHARLWIANKPQSRFSQHMAAVLLLWESQHPAVLELPKFRLDLPGFGRVLLKFWQGYLFLMFFHTAAMITSISDERAASALWSSSMAGPWDPWPSR